MVLRTLRCRRGACQRSRVARTTRGRAAAGSRRRVEDVLEADTQRAVRGDEGVYVDEQSDTTVPLIMLRIRRQRRRRPNGHTIQILADPAPFTLLD